MLYCHREVGCVKAHKAKIGLVYHKWHRCIWGPSKEGNGRRRHRWPPCISRQPSLPSLLSPLGWTDSNYWLSSGQLLVQILSFHDKGSILIAGPLNFDCRASWLLQPARVRPPHVFPDPGLAAGLVQPHRAHFAKLPRHVPSVKPGV